MLWMIVAVGVVLIGCGAGFGVSRLLGGSSPGRQAEPAAGEPEGQASDTGQGEPNAKDQEHLYYDFEPIVVNLDEPRLGRHIKATITLAIKKENHKAATGLLDKKMPELKNWMMVFLAGCSLDEVRGAKNLNRLRREIQERFNERLWPDRKPMIEEVLFKEFSVQ